MKAFDCVNKQEVEVTKEGLIDFMKRTARLDMKFAGEENTIWDIGPWVPRTGHAWTDRTSSCVVIRWRAVCLRDSTSHNIYDMEMTFPEQAMEIQIN